MKKVGKKIEVKHDSVYLRDRGFRVDELILPTLRTLWHWNINTYFSCQGGVVYLTKKHVYFNRAYVMVHEKDMHRACSVLENDEPMIELCDQTSNRGLICIRFTPCEKARGAIPRKYFERSMGMQKIASAKLLDRKE